MVSFTVKWLTEVNLLLCSVSFTCKWHGRLFKIWAFINKERFKATWKGTCTCNMLNGTVQAVEDENQ